MFLACTWFLQRNKGLLHTMQPGWGLLSAAKDIWFNRVAGLVYLEYGDVSSTAAARSTEANCWSSQESPNRKERVRNCCLEGACSMDALLHVATPRPTRTPRSPSTCGSLLLCLHRNIRRHRAHSACPGCNVKMPSIVTSSTSGLLGPLSETLACLELLLKLPIVQGKRQSKHRVDVCDETPHWNRLRLRLKYPFS